MIMANQMAAKPHNTNKNKPTLNQVLITTKFTETTQLPNSYFIGIIIHVTY